MARFAVAIVSIALVATFASAATVVEIKLSASDLDDQDVCCGSGYLAPDTFAVVSYADSNYESLKEVGGTSVIDNDKNPVWPEIFTFTFSNNDARVRIDLWDEDIVDSDDFIGFVEFRLIDLVNSFGTILSKPISSATQGVLTIAGRINGTSSKGAIFDASFNHGPRPILSHVHPKISPKFSRA